MKLTQLNAGIAVNVGMALWSETQAAPVKMRGKQAPPRRPSSASFFAAA